MKTVIGLGGPAGSGKDSLTAALVEQGCVEFYSGGHLRERAKAEGFVPAEVTREAFVPFWQDVAEREGRDWLARAAFDLQEESDKPVIFNGTRIPEDADFITANDGLNVFLYATADELYRRIVARDREDDSIIYDLESYRQFHDAEMDGSNEIAIGAIANRSEHFLIPIPFTANEAARTAAYTQLATYVLNDLAT